MLNLHAGAEDRDVMRMPRVSAFALKMATLSSMHLKTGRDLTCLSDIFGHLRSRMADIGWSKTLRNRRIHGWLAQPL